MHLVFTPNHVHLITACYPSSSALLSSGPQYLPNSQELSRLTYYASNHPGKINKLGSELEKRIKTECRKAQTGNIRAKALGVSAFFDLHDVLIFNVLRSLLISLSISRALVTECRRDVSLLSPSLLASVNTVLSALSSDLEVAARTASVVSLGLYYCGNV